MRSFILTTAPPGLVQQSFAALLQMPLRNATGSGFASAASHVRSFEAEAEEWETLGDWVRARPHLAAVDLNTAMWATLTYLSPARSAVMELVRRAPYPGTTPVMEFMRASAQKIAKPVFLVGDPRHWNDIRDSVRDKVGEYLTSVSAGDELRDATLATIYRAGNWNERRIRTGVLHNGSSVMTSVVYPYVNSYSLGELVYTPAVRRIQP